MNWGLAILFNFIGIFFFDLLIYLLELGFVVSLLFVILGLVAVVCTAMAWKNDAK